MLEFQNRPEIFIMQGLNGTWWKPQGSIFGLFIFILSAPSDPGDARASGSRDYEDHLNHMFERVNPWGDTFQNHDLHNLGFLRPWHPWSPTGPTKLLWRAQISTPKLPTRSHSDLALWKFPADSEIPTLENPKKSLDILNIGRYPGQNGQIFIF